MIQSYICVRQEKAEVMPYAHMDGARELFTFGDIDSHFWAILTHFSTLFLC